MSQTAGHSSEVVLRLPHRCPLGVARFGFCGALVTILGGSVLFSWQFQLFSLQSVFFSWHALAISPIQELDVAMRKQNSKVLDFKSSLLCSYTSSESLQQGAKASPRPTELLKQPQSTTVKHISQVQP